MAIMDQNSLAVAEGLFAGMEGDAHLIGSRCLGCGSYYFPQSLSCRNPRCEDKRLESIPLSRQGRLYSFTVQHYRPPALFRWEHWAPYALGVIELPEGLRVMAMLAEIDLSALAIDMPMVLTLVPLYHNDEGHPVLTYAFKPEPSAQVAA
jgi:uncharacterized OB-fold protein